MNFFFFFPLCLSLSSCSSTGRRGKKISFKAFYVLEKRISFERHELTTNLNEDIATLTGTYTRRKIINFSDGGEGRNWIRFFRPEKNCRWTIDVAWHDHILGADIGATKQNVPTEFLSHFIRLCVYLCTHEMCIYKRWHHVYNHNIHTDTQHSEHRRFFGNRFDKNDCCFPYVVHSGMVRFALLWLTKIYNGHGV